MGARIVGIGLLRHCLANEIDVKNLIDSDNAIINRSILEKIVISPEEFRKNIEKEKGKAECVLIIAASTKEIEIKESLEKLQRSRGN